jgi:hypothetical protein
MQDLPLELLIDGIWPNLTLFDIFRRARYTCKLWNSNIELSIKSLDLTDSWDFPGRIVMMRQGEWKKSKLISRLDPKRITGHLKVPTTAYFGSKEYLDELLSHFQYVTKLSLQMAHPEGALWGVDHSIARLPHLQELSVGTNSWCFDDEVNKILVPKLVSLSVSYDSTGLLLNFAKAMTNLRHIRVNAVSEGDVASHLPYLSSLRSLDYAYCDWDVPKLPPRLTSLRLVCDESGELPSLAECASTLKFLCINNLTRLTSAQLPPALKLVSLDMITCHPRILKDLAPALPNLECFTFRYRLEYPLDVSQLSYVSSVSTLVLYAPAKLDESFLSHFPNLRHLHLYSEESGAAFVPEALWPTSVTCPDLRSLILDMYGTPSKFIEGLSGIANLESIYFLCLADEPVSTEAWSALASLTSLTSLRILAQSKTKAVSKSEEDVLYLCEHLDRLNHLTLGDVVAIEDAEVLKQLCRRLHMEHPALDRCTITTVPKNYIEPDW